MSLAEMPLKLIRGFLDIKWTKKNVSWAIAYIYTLYVALGAVPPFKGTVAFALPAASVLLVLLYMFHSFTNLNPKTAAKFLAVAAVISFLWEFLGVTTGVPFGPYNYTSALGPELGPVPLFIPLLWCALGYFCMQASDHYVIASALMVTLDLSFDPVFSTSLGLWKWTGQTQYFGVPFTNFLGWFIASLSFFAVFYFLTKRQVRSSSHAVAFYYLFSLDNVVGDLVSGFSTLAIVSFIIFTIAAATLILVHRSRSAKARILTTEPISTVTRQPVPSH